MKLYFIITELMNNILKHSNASEAKVIINEYQNQLSIRVQDNGKGFEAGKSQKSEGFGLTQIRARIRNMKGKFIIDSKPGQGTIISINIPIVD
jgi:signal transduction histidine kinase